jgi:hypothetical protein
MSDPYALWRAAEGLAKRKTVEIVFPELAAALGGTSVAVPGAGPAEPEPQPVCQNCRVQWARVTIGEGGKPICGMCVGLLPYGVDRPELIRRPDWPKIGPLDRKKRR